MLLSVVGVLCLLASCETTSVSVTTNHDPSANFAKYRTYTLAPPKAGQTLSPVAETALHDALRTELSARGLTEAPAKTADLHIVRHVSVHSVVSVQQVHRLGLQAIAAAGLTGTDITACGPVLQ